MLIEVFGPGCAKCETLFKHAKHAVEQSGEAHEAVNISDYAAMAQRGILSTPALAIHGLLRSQGKVLGSPKILDLLRR